MPHHRDKDIEGFSRVASRQRTDFGYGFGHLESFYIPIVIPGAGAR
jgi:hypothetical protein